MYNNPRCFYSRIFGVADYGRPWPYERVDRRRRDGMERAARKSAAPNIRLWNQIQRSILIPRLDLDVVDAGGAEGADESGGEAGVGEEGDVEVYGRSSDLVAV